MNIQAKHSADATTVEEGLAIQEEQAKFDEAIVEGNCMKSGFEIIGSPSLN